MNHVQVIRLWPTAAALASDLQLDPSKGARLVNMWAYRQAIPPKRFADVVAAAEKRGFQNISLQALYDAVPAAQSGNPGAN